MNYLEICFYSSREPIVEIALERDEYIQERKSWDKPKKNTSKKQFEHKFKKSDAKFEFLKRNLKIIDLKTIIRISGV